MEIGGDDDERDGERDEAHACTVHGMGFGMPIFGFVSR
jgi:hypothetical protein